MKRIRLHRFSYKEYLVDYYGYLDHSSDNATAVIVLNRNLPFETEGLCNAIIERTSDSYDLFVTESGSDPDRLCRYSSFHFVDQFSVRVGLRIPRGLNASIDLVDMVNPGKYSSYWFITNDVLLTAEVDYVEVARRIFDHYPRVGILEPCCEPDRHYTLNYEASAQKVSTRRLARWRDYTTSIREKKFSIIPFPVIRSVFLRRDLVRDLTPVLDETNWRNWGNDEDLGYRAWKAGWWVVTSPFCTVKEDMFLSTRRFSETRTECLEVFKSKAEADMHHFIGSKYNTDVAGLRRMVYVEMLEHLSGFEETGVDIAHCVTSGVHTIHRLLSQKGERRR